MLTAVEYLGKVGVGITCPEFFRADDGKTYVVKRSNNYIGWQVLVSELLAINFGKALHLPFPAGGIIDLNHFLTSKNFFSPLGFASAYIEHAEYATKDNILQTKNLKEMAGILLFDHLFHNGDRIYNRKNLLVAKQDAGFFLFGIDHSHLFNTGRWNIDALTGIASQIKVYMNDLGRALLCGYLCEKDFFPYAQAIKTLSPVDIINFLNDIPNEWIKARFVKKTIYEFIFTRCQRIDEITEAILKVKEKSVFEIQNKT